MKTLIALATALTVSTTAAWAFPLIKADEAKLPAASLPAPSRGIFRGPAIKVVSPDVSTSIPTTFNLRVQFEPRGESKIDIGATKVTYLKATPVDLLPRIKGGLSEQGIVLEGAEVPAGEHLIQISIQDTEGRTTQSIIRLNAQR